MPNYRQTNLTGDVYQRAFQVVCDNMLQGVPRANFLEEEVITLSDGRIIRQPVTGCGIDFAPGTEFPLVSPVDDSVIGTGSHDQLQILLYSLYRALRSEIDALQAPKDVQP